MLSSEFASLYSFTTAQRVLFKRENILPALAQTPNRSICGGEKEKNKNTEYHLKILIILQNKAWFRSDIFLSFFFFEKMEDTYIHFLTVYTVQFLHVFLVQ